MLNKNKEIFFNILTCVSALFLLSLCAELFIRLSPIFYRVGYRPSRNDKIVYELYPGHKIRALNAKISSQGLHDRFFSIEKQKGVFRIAVVGDSTSFGWGVSLENNFPKVLERMLNERKDRKYEVINFSVPGYNTSQEFEILKEKVIRFNPDMVMLFYCGNDTHVCNTIKPKITLLNYSYNKSYLIRFLLRKFDLMMQTGPPLRKIWLSFKKNILGMFYYNQIIHPYPGLEETIYIKGNPPDAKKDVPMTYWYMLGYENYRIHLSNIYNLLRSQGIKFISSGTFDEKALKINQELGIENIFDLSKIFSLEGIPYDNVILPQDVHWNAIGHRLIAKHLYKFLKIKKLL